MALKLEAQIALDGSGFQSGINKISAALGPLKNLIAGAFTVGAISNITKRATNLAGNFNDLSSRLGVSTDFLQEFRYVAKQTGTDLEKLTKIMETLRESRDAALSGPDDLNKNKQLAGFSAFGIGKKELSGRIEDLISGPIAKSFEKGDVQGKLGAAWKQIGGKSAGELVSAFTEGFNGLRKAAHDQTRIWTEDEIQQLDAIGDQFVVLGDQMTIVFGNALLNMIGLLRKWGSQAEGLLDGIVAGTSKWTGKDWIANAINFINPFAKVGDNGAAKFDTDSAVQANIESLNEDKKKFQEEIDARERFRIQRQKSRSTNNPIESVLPQASIRSQGDPGVAVGNFLGSSASSLSRIGQETNRLLGNIDNGISNMTSLLRTLKGDSLGVPPTS